MARQQKMLAKKKGRPAIGKGEQVVVRLQPELLQPLDEWIAEQNLPPPTRAASLRIALRSWLLGQGKLK
jgi:hypothetical protein